MARGPNGQSSDSPIDPAPGLSRDATTFMQGMEAAIDRALVGHRPGETFLYGIHQELPDGVAEALAARYLAAGWSEASVRLGATGAHNVVLIP